MSPTAANAGAMTQAAQTLLAALPAAQHGALCFPFDDPERRRWHYTPGARQGVALGDMDRRAARAVHQLLATALSRAAHARVAAITGLEDVLDEIEGGSRARHAGDYWTAVFGDPGSTTWGWRFEGHHVSINLTVVDGAVCGTPCFLGANPAVVTDEDGRCVSRPLAPEENVAFDLLASLDTSQKHRAVVSREPPGDIVSGETADVASVAALAEPVGLPATALRPDQVWLLRKLAAVYVNRLAPDAARPIMAHLEGDLPAFCFTWAGCAGPAPGQPHYYRLQAPHLLIEFANRQNGANHIHSVWREPGGDFGARLLSGGGPDVS